MKIAITLLIFMVSMMGCTNTPEAVSDNASSGQSNAIQHCPEERPQICTRIYQPVCATRDNGIRCVKAPCPSTENKTYGNSCTACADTKVIGYVPGECPESTQHN